MPCPGLCKTACDTYVSGTAIFFSKCGLSIWPRKGASEYDLKRRLVMAWRAASIWPHTVTAQGNHSANDCPIPCPHARRRNHLPPSIQHAHTRTYEIATRSAFPALQCPFSQRVARLMAFQSARTNPLQHVPNRKAVHARSSSIAHGRKPKDKMDKSIDPLPRYLARLLYVQFLVPIKVNMSRYRLSLQRTKNSLAALHQPNAAC